MRGWRGLPAVAGAFLLVSAVLMSGSPVFAQFDDFPEADDAEARKEELMKVLNAVLAEEAKQRKPSVLRDFDPKNASPDDRKVARILRTTRMTLSFEKAPVTDVLDTFREVTGLTFHVSKRARKRLEEEAKTVTLSLRDLPLENVLNLMALILEEYRFTIRYGAVLFVHAEEYEPRRELRVYDVTDLVRPRRDFPAPQLGLGTERENW